MLDEKSSDQTNAEPVESGAVVETSRQLEVKNAINNLEQGPQSIEVGRVRPIMILFIDTNTWQIEIDRSTILAKDVDTFIEYEKTTNALGTKELGLSMNMISLLVKMSGGYEKIEILAKGQEIPQEILAHNAQVKR